jgi:hypothetical protein
MAANASNYNNYKPLTMRQIRAFWRAIDKAAAKAWSVKPCR